MDKTHKNVIPNDDILLGIIIKRACKWHGLSLFCCITSSSTSMHAGYENNVHYPPKSKQYLAVTPLTQQ